MEEKKLNLFQKLAKISAEIKSAEKDLEITIGANKYKAVSESVILSVVKPLEEKYGIYSYPVSRAIVDSNLVTTKDSRGNEKTQFYERIETIYRFVDIDNPTDYIEITSYGDGIDNGDKSVGKAMTYADKYALMKAYKIVTGDDPDKVASEEGKKELATPMKLSPEMLKQAALFNISLEKLAVYNKKPITELTNEDVLNAIELKKKARENK